MVSKWQKAKLALGLKNLCLYVPKTHEDRSSSSSYSMRSGVVVSISPAKTTVASSSGLGGSSSKNTCAICLTATKTGQGQAIFTAECSHSFHFNCITSNVKHGNQICPVCRAKWDQIPLQAAPAAKSTPACTPRRPSHQIHQPYTPPETYTPVYSIFNVEPSVFDDDDALDQRQDLSKPDVAEKLQVKTYPEFKEVLRSVSYKEFSVLINLKAPAASKSVSSLGSSSSRAPVDLVTVLDSSGSMSGTKLELLKRAMCFVIQNLSPCDRLSIVSFSCKAHRNFPLRLMTETGKLEALQAVNALVSNGGTNIEMGVRKGARVLVERRFKNPVSSIVLLSDGQDSYNSFLSPNDSRIPDYKAYLPKETNGNYIPVHTFGFGSDHDASTMHSIAETSGGTFSFIESETVIQDAFAQCIGGLLSVVVQELCVKIDCVHPELRISSVKSGSYGFTNGPDSRTGSIGVGDLYAEEERNFLVNLDLPVVDGFFSNPMSLLKVRCVYKDPVTRETVDTNAPRDIKILRPTVMSGRSNVVSVEVDRQRIRLIAAEAISEARVFAERCSFTEAESVLRSCIRDLKETASGRAGDPFCVSLCMELKMTQERVKNREVYEDTGRAYVLSGMSSHSWQRATARGDLTDITTTSSSYRTQAMADMVNLSQTVTFGIPVATSISKSNTAAQKRFKQALSFPARPSPS
ncbi:unnamed protein product [Cochlearia groenlandica]